MNIFQIILTRILLTLIDVNYFQLILYNFISQVKIRKHDESRYLTHRPVEKRIFSPEGKKVSRKGVR